MVWFGSAHVEAWCSVADPTSLGGTERGVFVRHGDPQFVEVDSSAPGHLPGMYRSWHWGVVGGTSRNSSGTAPFFYILSSLVLLLLLHTRPPLASALKLAALAAVLSPPL